MACSSIPPSPPNSPPSSLIHSSQCVQLAPLPVPTPYPPIILVVCPISPRLVIDLLAYSWFLARNPKRSSWGRSRRTFMACTECRRRQVKVSFLSRSSMLRKTPADPAHHGLLRFVQCTPSDSAGQACERCVKRKIKCEFMSIQEQKLLSTPDNDQSSSSVTLHLPQYGGPAGGPPSRLPAGPILGDPADVRQGILSPPVNHPLVHPTGMPIPSTAWPPHHQPGKQQIIDSSAQTYHRPGSPSWIPQQYPQPVPTPLPRYATPNVVIPMPQSATSIPTWHPANIK